MEAKTKPFAEYLEEKLGRKVEVTLATDYSTIVEAMASGKVDLGNPEKDLDFGRLLQWLRVSVVPSLKMLEELGEEKGFDIYQIIKNIEVDEYSKKQNRLLNNAKKIDKSQINLYLQKFEEGGL